VTLKADMITDLDEFFNTDEFADAAIYTPAYVAPAVAAPVTINVLFNKEYDAMSNVGGFRYWCIAKTTDVLSAKPNETMVINSVTYKIKSPPHHTGDGTSEIELSID